MMDAARISLPVGRVPDYATFKRHVWTYEDPRAGSVVGAPPWIYSIVFEEEEEAAIVIDLVEMLLTKDDPDRVRVVKRIGDGGTVDGFEISFANLGLVHRLLQSLAVQSELDCMARQIGEFLMWTLGFRWV